MFTNQRILGAFLIIFIVGAGIYFAISKFKEEVSSVTVSPSPSASVIDFIFDKNPAPAEGGQSQQTSQPKPSELSLSKTKKLSKFPGILHPSVLQNKAAVISTKKGEIAIEIYPEASMAASNFLYLASNGFYDGLTFHRIEDWVVQGGDPTGTGRGGPGYQFPDEPVWKAYVKGIVAMANAGPNTNGSQFFILKQDYPLQPIYTIFGQVIAGMDVVEKLSVGDVMQKVTVQNLQ